MKRSEINQHIRDAASFFGDMHRYFEPWTEFSPKRWKQITADPLLRAKYAEILEKRLGWDITDFGSEDFSRRGLLLLTTINGTPNTGRAYARKSMIVGENQETPWHFHWKKTEDIICEAGGNLVVELYRATKQDDHSPEELDFFWRNGVFDENKYINLLVRSEKRSIPPGGQVILSPGEGVVLEPRVYHRFYGQKGKGKVLVGEVSSVNDDRGDNRFYKQLPRFPPIEEDEAPLRLLCGEYEKAAELAK